MEALTHLVSESLARHGFDRPLDYRRLHWSRWFRCESPHSLLLVPSKPGVFAIAEEIGNTGADGNDAHGNDADRNHVAPPRFAGTSGLAEDDETGTAQSAPRMLAVSQFVEADDMAFVLDRMFTRRNPMQVLLNSGRYFVRFVVIEDAFQRRSISNALNQWIANSAEKISGIGAHFATSLELPEDTVKKTVPEPNFPANSSAGVTQIDAAQAKVVDIGRPSAPFCLDESRASRPHAPDPLPSGF